MVLDTWIIDDITRREEGRRRRDRNEPRVYYDISDTVPPGYHKRDTPFGNHEEIIVPPAEEEKSIGTVIYFANSSVV